MLFLCVDFVVRDLGMRLWSEMEMEMEMMKSGAVGGDVRIVMFLGVRCWRESRCVWGLRGWRLMLLLLLCGSTMVVTL